MKDSTARAGIRSRLFTLLAATALVALLAPSVLATTDYATVTGHQAHSDDRNNPAFWGDDCTKKEFTGEVDTFVLTEDYALVVVKSGSGEFANTLFANASAGQTVWADTNGNNAFDEDDKAISHIIFCGPVREGSLRITKDVEGGPANFSGDFDIHVDCGAAGDFDRTISFPEPGSVTITGIDADAECTVTETDTPNAPTGFTWGAATFTGNPATIESGKTVTVGVVNHLNAVEAEVGSLKVTKTVEGGPANFSGDFAIHVDCGSAGEFNRTITFPNPGFVTISDIDADAECTVTETDTPNAPSGFTWGSATFTGNPGTIEAGKTVTVGVVNHLNAVEQELGTLQITKVVEGGPENVEGSFGIRVTCTGSDPINRTIEFPAPGKVTIGDLPVGASCLVVETSRSDPPAGFGWAGVLVYGPVTIEADGKTEVTVTNVLTALQSAPTLTIDKTNNAPLVKVGNSNLPTADEGDTVTFTLTYALSDGPVADAIITDVIPAGLNYVSGSASSNSTFTFAGYNAGTRTLTWTADDVSAGGSVTYQVVVADGAAAIPQPLRNVVTIDSADTAPDTDDSDVFVPVPPLGEVDTPIDNVPEAPQTDVLDSTGTAGGGLNTGLLLILGIGVLIAGIMFITPMPSTARRRDRR
jgi:uncharacterized repeat protein (TIGR01451 family)